MGLFDRILKRLRGEPEPARQDAPGLFTARSPGVPTERADTGTAAPPEEDLWDRPEPSPAPPEVLDPVEPDVTEPVVLEPGVLEPEDVEPEDADDDGDVAGPVDPEAELAAIEELAPPAEEPETPVDPVWDEDAWADAGATTELAQQPPVEDTPHEDTPAGDAVAPAEDAVAPAEDAVAPAGSTADEPLFAAYETAPEPPEAEEPAPDPVPPLFDPPELVAEPEPEDIAPGLADAIEPEPPAPTAEPTPEPEPEPITPDPDPEPVIPEPEPEPEPQGLVVETHPEVFEPTPAEDAAPTDDAAPAEGAGPVARDEPTAAAEERTMRVHDERLDKRPGPIRMTPSEAIRLAQDGPRTSRRPDNPEA